MIATFYRVMFVFCSSRSEYIFKFDDKFEMHDDAEVLKRMGLLFGEFYISYICMLIAYILLDFIFLKGLDKGHCSYDDIERAKSLVPPNFEKYIEGMFCLLK